MSQHDDFDRSLARWFEAEARPTATAELLDRALSATRRRRPRPALFAALGSHWVDDSVGPAWVGATLWRSGLRTSMALLLLLLVLVLVGGAVLVGARLTQPAPVDLGIFEDGDSPPTSGSMWPQSTMDEVEEAQERADAGDPAYTWQLDAEILNGNPSKAAIVDRFIRRQLGWEDYRFNPFLGFEQTDTNLIYVRCASARTNRLYPEDEVAGQCAPTINELRYEAVRIDLAQPVRTDPTGIWVVTKWQINIPFAQSDPADVRARATARLEDFLQARIAGEGAVGYVDFGGRARVFLGGTDMVPLLYGTSTGAPYERYEIEVVGGPYWPYGDLEFDVRLFADRGTSVVEQPFTWSDSRLFHDRTETRENGVPLALPFFLLDDQVSLNAARPWVGGFERSSLDLGRTYPSYGADQEAIVLVADPLPSDTGCATGEPSADAEALAHSLRGNADLLVTTPVPVTVGGVAAVTMDVILAPEAPVGDSCAGVLRLSDGTNRRGANLSVGNRMRLYLFDVPEGLPMRILGIAVVAPEARFDSVLEAARPVIDSIEFHAP